MISVVLTAATVVVLFCAIIASTIAFGLQYYSESSARRKQASLSPSTTPPSETLPSSTSDAIPLRRWWPQVVSHNAHIMLVGETQSGKSTTAYALLYERAKTDKIIIIDPHEQKNPWPLPCVNHGRNYDEIEAIFELLHKEFERRYMPGEAEGPPLTIFIDELPSIVAMKKNIMTYLKQWLRESAKIKIRLIILSQDANVKTLGIDGEGPVRENLMKVLLGSFAAAVPGIETIRPAAIERRGTILPVSLDGVRMIAQQVVSSHCLWKLPKLSVISDDLQPVIEVPVRHMLSEFGGIPPVTSDDTTTVPADGLTPEVIKALHTLGWSRNKIAEQMPRGNKQTRLARIRAALGEAKEDEATKIIEAA